MFVDGDADQLTAIVGRIDHDDLRVDMSSRYPLPDIALVHQLGDGGELRGKVVLLPAARLPVSQDCLCHRCSSESAEAACARASVEPGLC
jgi:hypothetical protein